MSAESVGSGCWGGVEEVGEGKTSISPVTYLSSGGSGLFSKE